MQTRNVSLVVGLLFLVLFVAGCDEGNNDDAETDGGENFGEPRRVTFTPPDGSIILADATIKVEFDVPVRSVDIATLREDGNDLDKSVPAEGAGKVWQVNIGPLNLNGKVLVSAEWRNTETEFGNFDVAYFVE